MKEVNAFGCEYCAITRNKYSARRHEIEKEVADLKHDIGKSLKTNAELCRELAIKDKMICETTDMLERFYFSLTQITHNYPLAKVVNELIEQAREVVK